MTSFLTQLAATSAPQVEQELDVLRRMKAEDLGLADAQAPAAAIEPWDVEYYSNMAKARSATAGRASGKQRSVAAAASDYLKLKVVLSGFSELMEQLLGIQMVEVPITSCER